MNIQSTRYQLGHINFDQKVCNVSSQYSINSILFLFSNPCLSLGRAASDMILHRYIPMSHTQLNNKTSIFRSPSNRIGTAYRIRVRSGSTESTQQLASLCTLPFLHPHAYILIVQIPQSLAPGIGTSTSSRRDKHTRDPNSTSGDPLPFP